MPARPTSRTTARSPERPTVRAGRQPFKPAPAPSEPGAVAQLHVADALAEHRTAFEARRALRATREPLAAFVSWCERTASLASGVAAELAASESNLSACRDAVHLSRQERARVIGQRAAADQALAAARRGEDEPVDHALDLRDVRHARPAPGAAPDPEADPDLVAGIERLESALVEAERRAHEKHDEASAALRKAEARVAEAWIVAEEIDKEARTRLGPVEDAPRLLPGPVIELDALLAVLQPRLEALEAELTAVDATLDRTTETALDAAGRLVHERRAAGFQDPIRGFL